MSRGLKRAWTLILVVVLGLSLASCSGHGRVPFKGVIGPAEFLAVVSARTGITVDVVSAGSGKPVRQALPRDRGRDRLDDITRLPGTDFLVTYAHGPVCAGPGAGCFPKPHDCGGEVDRYNPGSGRLTTVWTVGTDTAILSATASPDASEIAAEVAPCAKFYFNDYLIIHRLSDGAEWRIGAGEQRCHTLRSPAWIDHSHLVVAFGAARGRPWTGPDGTCTESSRAGLTVVDADRPQSHFPPGRGAAGCDYQSTTAVGAWIYAVLACGSDYGLHGQAWLQRLSHQLAVMQRWSLGECTDGNDLAANRDGAVLISAYLFCNPPPPGQPRQEPHTVLDRLDGDRLTHITTTPPVGLLAYDNMAW